MERVSIRRLRQLAKLHSAPALARLADELESLGFGQDDLHQIDWRSRI